MCTYVLGFGLDGMGRSILFADMAGFEGEVEVFLGGGRRRRRREEEKVKGARGVEEWRERGNNRVGMKCGVCTGQIGKRSVHSEGGDTFMAVYIIPCSLHCFAQRPRIHTLKF